MTDINDITRAQIDAADAYFRRKGGHHLPGGFFWCELLAEVFGTTPQALSSSAPAVAEGRRGEAVRLILAEKERILTEGAASSHPEIWTANGAKANGLQAAADIILGMAAPHAMQEEALTGQTRLQRACSDPTGWCPKCGCGHDRAGFAHLPTCNGATPPAGEGREALEAVARFLSGMEKVPDSHPISIGLEDGAELLDLDGADMDEPSPLTVGHLRALISRQEG